MTTNCGQLPTPNSMIGAATVTTASHGVAREAPGAFRWQVEGRLQTTDILTALCELEEAPWGDLEGRPLDARRLAKELDRYGVKPAPYKDAGKTMKGYPTTGAYGLTDAWDRYLPPPSVIGNCGNCGNPAGQAVTDPHPVTDASVTPARSVTP
jgi:hypothetical protein